MKFIDPARDLWQPLGSEQGPAPHRLLTPEQWQALCRHWPAALPAGVVLANDADPAAIAADVGGTGARLALVVLQFPKWTDGRAYSQARLLRVRHGFRGELRAAGDVLVDMLPLLQRCGFDAVQLRPGQDLEAARRALGFLPGHYQGDVPEPLPLFARGRHPAGHPIPAAPELRP